jgi:transposase
MKRETITLDARAQWRLYVLNHILTGEVSAAEAARQLGLSIRSVRRLLARYRGPEGVAALVHGNAGRTPANRLDPGIRARIVELASTTYCGVNRTHLAELLTEREAIAVAARTVRRIAAEAGLPAVRRRRARGHRTRRERMTSAGLLLQVDGSRHDWLEGRGPMLTLVGGIDDATGIVTGAVFREQEDAAGYLEVLIQTANRHGLPLGLYSDRHGIFWKSAGSIPTLAEQFAGRRSTTQLGRALEVAGIAWTRPARRRPRVAWSGCGGPSRTASGPSSGSPARRRARPPTSSSPTTCPATMPGSRSHQPTPTRRGAYPIERPRRSSAFATPAS